MLFCCLLIFFKINFFSKNSFRNTIRVSNSSDPDQARHFVGPDLGPNCLQKLSPDDTSRQFQNNFFENFFKEYHQSVKQFGSRSLCQA